MQTNLIHLPSEVNILLKWSIAVKCNLVISNNVSFYLHKYLKKLNNIPPKFFDAQDKFTLEAE